MKIFILITLFMSFSCNKQTEVQPQTFDEATGRVAASVAKTPWQIKFDDYTKGLPGEVITFLNRSDECHHFGGEPAYDKAREKEIMEARAKRQCDSIDQDMEDLLKKYKNDFAVSEKIKNFEKWSQQ